MIRTLLLLGATGDLARRFLLPALGALNAAGSLPDGFCVLGAARSELDEHAIERLAGDGLPAEMLTYRAVDLAGPSTIAAALDGRTEPIAAYLALPPAMFATTIGSLAEVGLPPGSRVAIEKPFGDDLESAQKLNVLLAQTGVDAYRVDHVLGMDTVRNLVAMRRESPVLERVWDGESVERVEILWEETLALEGRAGYYDHSGALKDVLQNHLLQLLSLAAMDPAGDDGLHERKLEALRSVSTPTSSRRGRYTAGTLADGREVAGYADEIGVDPARRTETFAEVVFELGAPRWADTRFVLRAGKALSRRRKLVLLRFGDGSELEIGIDGPEDVVLRLSGAAPDPIELRSPAPGDGLPAYAHVLLDLLGGTTTLSVSGEEAEQAWRVVAPVLAAWKRGEVPLEEYPAGSVGPGP
jgi:glucose-6-phosphate 1-dehydrogenase